MTLPWQGTTPEISSEADSRYETPGGAQSKVNVSQAYLLHLLKFAVTGLSNGSEAAIARYSTPYDITYDWLKDRLDASDNRQLNYTVYNAKNYGVVGDGITDNTDLIQTLINSVTSGEIWFPKGTYRLTRKGSRTLTFDGTMQYYSLLLTNKSNITFRCDPAALFIVDVGETDCACGFVLDGCNNITFEGLNFKGIGTRTSKRLNEGVGISADNSKQIHIKDCTFEDMRGGARAYTSDRVFISGGLSKVKVNGFASGHFALYSTTNSIIEKCDSYGSTLDGEIFVYGGRSENCKIDKCNAYCYAYGDESKTIINGQGIMIDSGGRNCSITNCYAYGFYYGYGIKNASSGQIVDGNIAEKCKIGIYTGKGEETSPVNSVQITNNMISPNGGNGDVSPFLGSITDPIGITVTDCYGGAVISGNTLANSIDIQANADFYGMVIALSYNAPESSQGGFVITNNNFEFDNRNGSLYGTNKKYAIVVTSEYTVNNVIIDSNLFDFCQDGITTNPISLNHCVGVSISNNNFSAVSNTGLPIVSCYNTARLKMNDNNFNYHFGMLECFNSNGVSFSNNVSGESLAGMGKPAVSFDNCSYININGNISTRVTELSLDDVYFKTSNGSNWLSAQGNLINSANKDSSNWFSTTSVNTLIDNNVIN